MGFDFNFDLEKIDKKEMLSYASIVGYLILGKIGYQRLFKDLTIIDKERSIINEKGKKVLRINRISPKMFFKFVKASLYRECFGFCIQ